MNNDERRLMSQAKKHAKKSDELRRLAHDLLLNARDHLDKAIYDVSEAREIETRRKSGTPKVGKP